MLLPDKLINHIIDLIPSVSLPNESLHYNLVFQNKEIKHQINYLLTKVFIKPNISHLAYLILFFIKKDGTWYFLH